MALGAIPTFTAGNVAIVELNLNTREEQLTMRIKLFATKIKNWIHIQCAPSQSTGHVVFIDYIPFYLIWFDLGSFDLLSTLAHCGVHACIEIRKYWNWIQSISLNQRPWSIIESCRCIRNGRVCGGSSIKTAFSTDVPSIMHRKSPSPSRLRNFSNEHPCLL